MFSYTTEKRMKDWLCAGAYLWRTIMGGIKLMAEKKKAWLYLKARTDEDLKAQKSLLLEYADKAGYQWTVHAIARILKNEKYTGNSLWQKSFMTQTLPRRYKVNKGELAQYYVKDTHPPIITCSVYDKAQELLRIRKEQFHPQGMESSRLSGHIECGCCGSTFRKVQHGGKVYHACRAHTLDRKKCPTKQIPESEFEHAFLRLYYKLRHRGMPILSQLLTDLQTVQNGKLLWSLDIVEANKQIADIVRQERLLAELKQQGLVDPDIYITRSSTLAEQLRTAKLEKERFLESEEDQTIRQTQVLLEI